jgi:hypothetical protein
VRYAAPRANASQGNFFMKRTEFSVRALKLHSLYAQDFDWIKKAMAFLEQNRMNTLILHRNDFDWEAGIADLTEDYRRLTSAQEKGVTGIIFRTDRESFDGHSSFKTQNLINRYSAAAPTNNIKTPARDIYYYIPETRESRDSLCCREVRRLHKEALDFLPTLEEETRWFYAESAALNHVAYTLPDPDRIAALYRNLKSKSYNF